MDSESVFNIVEWLLHDGGTASIMLLAVFVVVLWPKVQSFLGRFNKIKMGSMELVDDSSGALKEKDKKIDKSKLPCPYTEQREQTFSEMRGVHEKVDGMEKRLIQVEKHLDEVVTSLGGLNDILQQFGYEQWQQTFYMNTMPTELRLLAGLRYVSAGRNGKMKKDVLEFAEDNCKLYSAITAVDETLRVPELEVSCRIDGE